MQIEVYFHQLQAQIDGAAFVISSAVNYDKRGPSLGFIRGDLILDDGSTLHFREFVDTQTTSEYYCCRGTNPGRCVSRN